MKKVMYLIFIVTILFSGLSIHQASSKDKKQDNYVNVVYFHGDFRCHTCKTIEKNIKDVVEIYFSKELNSGNVKFKVINFDKKENGHFIDKYNMYNQTLIISKFENGKEKKWKNLEKIWEFVSNQSKFFEYVKKEIDEYKKG